MDFFPADSVDTASFCSYLLLKHFRPWKSLQLNLWGWNLLQQTLGEDLWKCRFPEHPAAERPRHIWYFWVSSTCWVCFYDILDYSRCQQCQNWNKNSPSSLAVHYMLITNVSMTCVVSWCCSKPLLRQLRVRIEGCVLLLRLQMINLGLWVFCALALRFVK